MPPLETIAIAAAVVLFLVVVLRSFGRDKAESRPPEDRQPALAAKPSVAPTPKRVEEAATEPDEPEAEPPVKAVATAHEPPAAKPEPEPEPEPEPKPEPVKAETPEAPVVAKVAAPVAPKPAPAPVKAEAPVAPAPKPASVPAAVAAKPAPAPVEPPEHTPSPVPEPRPRATIPPLVLEGLASDPPPPPKPASATTRAAAPAPAPAPAPAAAAAASLEASDPLHKNARKLARLLVSEIKLYNEKLVVEGIAAGDLYRRLKEPIDQSLALYDRRVTEEVRAQFDYLHDELVRQLAGGNAAKMGPGYTGPRGGAK